MNLGSIPDEEKYAENTLSLLEISKLADYSFTCEGALLLL